MVALTTVLASLSGKALLLALLAPIASASAVAAAASHEKLPSPKCDGHQRLGPAAAETQSAKLAGAYNGLSLISVSSKLGVVQGGDGAAARSNETPLRPSMSLAGESVFLRPTRRSARGGLSAAVAVEASAAAQRSSVDGVSAAAATAGSAGTAGAATDSTVGSGAASSSAGGTQVKTNGPKSATWFGSFSEGESTYDEDGNNLQPEYLGGIGRTKFSPGIEGMPIDFDRGMDPEWFKESVSGGPVQAWQTSHPELDPTHPRSFRNPPWISGQQFYDHLADEAEELVGETQAKPPAWFDTGIRGYDAFGRSREPTAKSSRRFLEWPRRSRKANLTCEPQGCTASTSLQAFDPDTELHEHCRLSVWVHATDFDDEYSRENVEWITVNGRSVVTKCDPMKSGCDEQDKPTSERALYPCAADMELEEALVSSGQLNVSGKISPMVDECPVDGNLLSGVVEVTCFVLEKTAFPAVTPEEEAAQVALETINGTAPLQCSEPGCEAKAEFSLSIAAMANRTCDMTLKVIQTDFDSDHGSTELIEWVKVDNAAVKSNVKPGKNPCKEALLAQGAGAKVDRGEPFAVLTETDVTEALKDGLLTVTAKLSDMVDECGSNGFLLDGLVTVECKPVPSPSSR